MSAKESILQTQPIFTHVIPQVAGQLDSLIIGVMITVDGIITFFARDTVVCKNPQGQGRQVLSQINTGSEPINCHPPRTGDPASNKTFLIIGSKKL